MEAWIRTISLIMCVIFSFWRVVRNLSRNRKMSKKIPRVSVSWSGEVAVRFFSELADSGSVAECAEESVTRSA